MRNEIKFSLKLFRFKMNNSTISENSTYDFKRLVSLGLMPYVVLNTFGIIAGLFGNINNNNFK